MDLVSYKYENNYKNKLVGLTTVGKIELRKLTIICEETQYNYSKAFGEKFMRSLKL